MWQEDERKKVKYNDLRARSLMLRLFISELEVGSHSFLPSEYLYLH